MSERDEYIQSLLDKEIEKAVEYPKFNEPHCPRCEKRIPFQNYHRCIWCGQKIVY